MQTAQPKPKQVTEQRAREIAEPILSADGFELVDAEFVHEREGWVLRLYIDKPGGVTLEDCSAASRAVDTALEVEELVAHEYHLEVSSPGLNRPLTRPAHFLKAIGQRIKVKTYGPVATDAATPRKNFAGRLSAADEESITVEVEGAGPFRIAHRDIAKANLDFDFRADLKGGPSHTGA